VIPRRRQCLGRRAPQPRAGLGARRSDEPHRHQDVPAYLLSASSHEIADLRLGKKTDELYAHAETLQDQIDRYASC
jgi:hypothetical protein